MAHLEADGPSATHELNRSPAHVWEQLTSAEGFEQWMGSGSTIKAEPGGDLIAADPESGVPKIGRVLDAEVDRHIRWVWRPLGDQPGGAETTEVLVELTPNDTRTGTIITVVERPSPLTVAPVCTTGVALASASALVGTSR